MFTMGGELIGIPPSFEENVKAATKRIELRFVSANRGDAHTADRMIAMLRDAGSPFTVMSRTTLAARTLTCSSAVALAGR
jgi:hypothetical protein